MGKNKNIDFIDFLRLFIKYQKLWQLIKFQAFWLDFLLTSVLFLTLAS